jgi:biopolymer transport protein ExbD
MPSVKIPKKSTWIDMTPFVDVAFLILTFFIMATKFKPAEPVEIKTPNSVSTRELPDTDALQVTFDSTGRVFFSVLAEKDPKMKYDVIKHISESRNLGLSEDEMKNFVKSPAVGVPFSGLKQLLSYPLEEQKNVKQPGIPLDTLGGELYYWIRDAVGTFTGKQLKYLVKGDNEAKFPTFKMVLAAFKKNDIYKFNLITMLEDAPAGTELYLTRQKEKEHK